MKKSTQFVIIVGIILVIFLLGLIFGSCTGCNKVQENKVVNTTLVDTLISIDVEHAIAMDRQAMYLKFGNNYRWYETDMRLPEFLDAENVTSDPTILVNIFQSIIEEGNGYDTWVWKFQHFPDGTIFTDSIQGFWIENMPLNEDTIKLTYKEAFNRMMEANFPKPHSKNVVLRNPVGPIGVNAQWIFGNLSEQLWCDAVTGDVRNSNPAFPEEKGFKMPLGEWP